MATSQTTGTVHGPAEVPRRICLALSCLWLVGALLRLVTGDTALGVLHLVLAAGAAYPLLVRRPRIELGESAVVLEDL